MGNRNARIGWYGNSGSYSWHDLKRQVVFLQKQCFHRLPDHGIDKTGIAPDVRMDIPYPTKLTDNVDEWVLWVAEDLKKKDR